VSSFARVVAALLALAVGACAFLPWTPGATGIELPLGSLLSPGERAVSGPTAVSVGGLVVVAALLVLVGAVANGRALVIVGGLVAVAVPTAWILVNAISTSRGAVPVSVIKIGAYGAAIAGLMTLILAAVAVDTRHPSLRD
jgi:hypothetical protein